MYVLCLCVSLKATIYMLQRKLDSRLCISTPLYFERSGDYLFCLNIRSGCLFQMMQLSFLYNNKKKKPF